MLTVDFDYFDLQPGHICVDLGCGEGRHSLTAFMAEGVTVLGFDLAFSDLKTAKSRISDMEPHNPAGDVSFVQANGMSLPLADNSVDRLICSEVLEHIPNYISFIEEIDRVLKPDGKLCITVPRAWPEKICWLLSDEYPKTPGGHIRIFNAKHLQREVERYDFEGTRRHGAHALHAPYWWLKCLFWNAEKEPWLLRAYHQFLVWDLMKRPLLTRALDALMNPWMGKSVALYFKRSDVERSDVDRSASHAPGAQGMR